MSVLPAAPPAPLPLAAHTLVEDADGNLVPAYKKAAKAGGEADGRRRCCCRCAPTMGRNCTAEWAGRGPAATATPRLLVHLPLCQLGFEPAAASLSLRPLPLAAHTLVEDADGNLVPAYKKAAKAGGEADGRCCCCCCCCRCAPTMRTCWTVGQRVTGRGPAATASLQSVDLPNCHVEHALPPPRRACSYTCPCAGSVLNQPPPRPTCPPAPRSPHAGGGRRWQAGARLQEGR